MTRPNTREVIVIGDSDSDDNLQPSASSVVLVDSIARIPSTANSNATSSRHPDTPRGKSEPTLCVIGLVPSAETRQRQTRSLPHNVIDVDADELSDGPPPKRARTDRLTPPPLPRQEETKIDIGAWDQGPNYDYDYGNRGAETCIIPKVVHGSAVEPGYIAPPRTGRKDFIWVTARRVAQTQQKHEKLLAIGRKQSRLTGRVRVNPLSPLQLSPVTSSFWLAGGAVNKIIQNAGRIAMCSATSGGQSEDSEPPARPQDQYNREGALQIWRDGHLRDPSTILHGHCVIESPGQAANLETTCLKCYTVNDLSFDPNRIDFMASTGNDGSVQLWQESKKLENGCYKYPRAPHDVAYREKDSLIAVACMNGVVYVHQPSPLSHYPLGDPVELRVAPQHAQHSVGTIVWGQEASADTLFASSEAQDMTDYSGYHVAFDPDQGRRAYEFNAKESGDGMALDPDGARLALCTASRDGMHSLRLYDVRRKNGQRPAQEVQLDPFYVAPGVSGSQPNSPEGEVKAVSFSPDGLLLAVARSDDELHVYDSRFMGSSREPMKRFLHWGEDHCVGGDRWGIVDAVWVDGWCGRGLGVVTGGSDGCVRFWDVRRSTDDISNGEVLAQPNSDIGHFSVGEPHNGEKPLVVGDNGGRIYVYDHATACR